MFCSVIIKNSKADFKGSLSTMKSFTHNVIKWKTEQSWKGNEWEYLFILPIFSPGAGSNVRKSYFLKLTKKYFIFSS